MATAASLSVFTSLRESGAQRSVATSGGRRVYKGVTVIKSGLGNKRDRNYYPPETLEAEVRNGTFKNLKAYADHQDSISEEVQPERTIRDLVGVYKNEKFVREGKKGRVTADLHLFRSSKWLSDTIDDLIDLGQASNIGLSINGRGQTVERNIDVEESDSPVSVNWVEGFSALRSADVVTEAGAGGGFQELLESARGSTHREKTMKRLSESQRNAIKAAADASDVEKLKTLVAECACEDAAAATGGKSKSKVKETKKTEEADPKAKKKATAVAEESEETEATETEEVDPNAALDEAVDEVTREADEAADGDADAEELDEAEDEGDDEDDLDDLDEDADADEAAEEDVAEGRAAREGAAVKLHTGGKQKNVKGVPAKGAGGSMLKRMAARKSQKGRKFGEADQTAMTSRERRLMEDNARLSAQLRVRTTADRARKLLRESAIPEKMRPEILRLMVGKSEEEMRRVVNYHETLIETAIAEATGYDSEVEGAGTSFRESHAGGSRRDFTTVLDGLPLKG